MISQTHLGCSTARNKGLCPNRRAVDRRSLEATILDALRRHLMAPDLFNAFCEEFFREVNRLRHKATTMRSTHEAELARTRKRLRQIVDAIGEGVLARTLKDELLTLEAREDFLQSQLADLPEQKVLLNPNMAGIYHDRVAKRPDKDIETIETIRSLIEKVVVTPVAEKVTIDLHGQIAAILRLSLGRKIDTDVGALTEQLVMVAGTRFVQARTVGELRRTVPVNW